MSSDQRPASEGLSGSAKPTSPKFLAIGPSIMLPMFLAVVDQTIVATALPAIAADTGNIARASWVVVSYLIASTVSAPMEVGVPDQHSNWDRRSAADRQAAESGA
jgi:hypothetical protein